MLSLGDRIAVRRKQLQLSQEQLAQMIGTNQKQISRYENDQNDPTADVVAALANALDTTTDWLLGLTDNPERPMRGETDLNDDERELLKLYRSKTLPGRKQIINIARVV